MKETIIHNMKRLVISLSFSTLLVYFFFSAKQQGPTPQNSDSVTPSSRQLTTRSIQPSLASRSKQIRKVREEVELLEKYDSGQMSSRIGNYHRSHLLDLWVEITNKVERRQLDPAIQSRFLRSLSKTWPRLTLKLSTEIQDDGLRSAVESAVFSNAPHIFYTETASAGTPQRLQATAKRWVQRSPYEAAEYFLENSETPRSKFLGEALVDFLREVGAHDQADEILVELGQ